MVYTGKPSRACATCKQRRIKCDEGRPACGQCTKSRRECTGYKTEAELMFRDETKVTAKRATKKKPKSITLSRPSSIAAGPVSARSRVSFTHDDAGIFMLAGETETEEVEKQEQRQDLWYAGKILSPNPALSVSLSEKANAFFFNRFTIYGTQHSYHLHNLLSELYMQSCPNDPIRATVDAVSMLTLSRKRGNEKAGPEAARAYANAVRQVGTAVADPVLVKENQTLLSVMMLGFAETLDISSASITEYVPKWTGKADERGIRRFHNAWGAHAAGAELIVTSRGLESMTDSKNSVSLALFVRLQTIQKNMWIAQPIQNLDKMWAPLDNFQAKVPPMLAGQIALATIGLQIPDLRHRGLNLSRKPMQSGVGAEMSQLLSDIHGVDAQLVEWYRKAKLRGIFHIAGYHVEPLSQDIQHERVWPGEVHSFDTLMLMNVVNLYRIYRLFLQMLVFNILERLIEPVLLETHPDFVACRATIACNVDEICATVPFGIDYLQNLSLSPTPVSTSFVSVGTPESMPDIPRYAEHDLRTPGPVSFDFSIHPDDPESPLPQADHDWDDRTAWMPTASDSANLEDSGPAIGAWYLCWPLYVTYSMISSGREQKNWIRGRLRYIAYRFGIAQALVYAHSDREVYQQGKPRRFMPLDFAPLPWEPVQ